ncbi:hypothetical protein Tco_1046220 [Tanacetum coccineum]
MNTAQDLKIRHLSGCNDGQLGYIDAIIPKYINKESGQRNGSVLCSSSVRICCSAVSITVSVFMNVSMVSKVLVQLDMHSVGYMVSGYNMVSDSSISSGLLGNESALVCFCDLLGISSVRVKVSVWIYSVSLKSSVQYYIIQCTLKVSNTSGFLVFRYIGSGREVGPLLGRCGQKVTPRGVFVISGGRPAGLSESSYVVCIGPGPYHARTLEPGHGRVAKKECQESLLCKKPYKGKQTVKTGGYHLTALLMNKDAPLVEEMGVEAKI